MSGIRKLSIAATLAALTAGCARLTQGSAAGEVFSPADAASTVVLHVDNLSTAPMELRTIFNGKSQFVGSVSGNDSTSLLLDPTMFPTGVLYVVAIPSDLQGRAVIGPLTATKGNQIRFTVQPALGMSSAIVVR